MKYQSFLCFVLQMYCLFDYYCYFVLHGNKVNHKVHLLDSYVMLIFFLFVSRCERARVCACVDVISRDLDVQLHVLNFRMAGKRH